MQHSQAMTYVGLIICPALLYVGKRVKLLRNVISGWGLTRQAIPVCYFC